VVDHGLRATSADEARVTVERLGGLGIAARALGIANLVHGPALAERARVGRYQVLINACRESGILHLLLGHHAADQRETLVMRVLRSSQTHGLAAMPAVRETGGVRLLRPLLAIEPFVLRQFLTARHVGWVEDPSNHDLRALRPRLRHALALVPQRDTGLAEAVAAAGRMRRRDEKTAAAELARCATIRPEGFALLSPGRISTGGLRSLIRTIGGAAYAPSSDRVAALAAQLKPATLAGVRLMPAGRLGDGMLVLREEAGISKPIAAVDGAVWDGRYRLIAPRGTPTDATIGKLGADATRFRRASELPAAILRTLPAIRTGEVLASVPHLGYDCRLGEQWVSGQRVTVLFAPESPAGGPAFEPAG
jgi:tRNA(Ile)-lysidine synthase